MRRVEHGDQLLQIHNKVRVASAGCAWSRDLLYLPSFLAVVAFAAPVIHFIYTRSIESG